MATRLSIANDALVELGQFPLEFATPEDAAVFGEAGIIDEEDTNQQRIKSIYPQVRNTMLNAHPWSWLTERHTPQASPKPASDMSPEQFRYALTYPWVSSVRAVFERGQPGTARPDGWEIRGGYLYSFFPIETIADQRQTAEEAWPQLFVTAVVLALAARLAMPILYDQDVARWYRQQAELALNDALRVDAQSTPALSIPVHTWLEARWNGVYGGRADRRRY